MSVALVAVAADITAAAIAEFEILADLVDAGELAEASAKLEVLDNGRPWRGRGRIGSRIPRESSPNRWRMTFANRLNRS
jgi:hypothetical protein